MKVLLATANRGKWRELANLFHGSPIDLRLPADEGLALPAVAETGSTYAENAVLKARALAQACGEAALADDSGLEVEALGGRPGVHSARYGGPDASDSDRNRRLLDELSRTGDRRARFRCALALALPWGETITAEGVLEGEIARTTGGEGGFGYDPVFFLPGRGKRVAELPPAEKDRISHRAAAVRNLLEQLSARGMAG